MVDELAQGEEAREAVERQGRRALPWALGVLCAAAVAYSLAGGGTGGRPEPLSSPEAPTSQPTIAAQVSVGEVCGVSTDGRDRLHVSFTLVNASDVSLRVLEVEPAFPMGGLRALSSSFRGTACDGPSQVASDRELVQGRTLPVVLRLALPVTCAAPLPVQAVVTMESHGLRAHQRVAVLRDLGGVELDACR